MAAASYTECLKRVLQHEGGYTNDPRDPGGPTNWGITIYDARMYWERNATAADVKAMPLSVATKIYKEKYWDALRCDDLPAGVDNSIFDYGVNSGIPRAGKVLRRVLGVPGTDWHVTDQVLAALKKRDTRAVILAINSERLRFLKGLRTWGAFGKGWNRRVAEVQVFSLQLAGADLQGRAAGVPQRTPSADVKGSASGKGYVGSPPKAGGAAAEEDFDPMVQQAIFKAVDETIRRAGTGGPIDFGPADDASQFPDDDNFERVQAIIDRWEGGLTISPDEPGGGSNMGVSRETLSQWRAQPVSMDDLRALTREEAHQIYRATFWNKLGGDRLPLPLALMTYNLAVMSGVPRGVTLLQRALNAEGASLEEDGAAGPATFAAAADADIAATVEQFAGLQEDFHRASSKKQYLSGWLNRLADVKETALSWADENAEPEPAPTWPELPVPGGVVSVGSSGPLVESLQKSLVAHGYYLGDADGIFGHLTTAAVLAFQSDNGLPTTGVADAATWAALDLPDQRPLSLDRVIATAKDVLALGSRTAAGGKNTRTVGIISALLGALGLGNSAVQQVGANQPAVNAGKTVIKQADVIGVLNQIEALKSLPKAQVSQQLKVLQDQINQILTLNPKQLSLPDLTQTFQQIENSVATVPNNQDLIGLLHQLESIGSGAQNVISDGNTQQLLTSGLELAANFLLPGFGGSLAALGIGLAASFLGNRVINNRTQDHVTGGNTGR